jgi:hypothetical protein
MKILSAAIVILALSAAMAWALQTEYKYKKFPIEMTLTDNSGQEYNIDSNSQISPLIPALITAKNLSPGKTEISQFSLKNNGQGPVAINLNLKNLVNSNITIDDFYTFRIIRSQNLIYNGSLADSTTDTIDLGGINAGKKVIFNLEATMSNQADNSQMQQSSIFDLNLDLKSVAKPVPVPPPVPPPDECVYRKIRTRLFVSKSRPFIRIVTRYQASRYGFARIKLYRRVWNGQQWVKGKYVAGSKFKFSASRKGSWNQKRHRRQKNQQLVYSLRHDPRGLIASLKVSKTPEYCQRFLNVDLIELRREFERQYVWFQKGSFKYQKK